MAATFSIDVINTAIFTVNLLLAHILQGLLLKNYFTNLLSSDYNFVKTFKCSFYPNFLAIFADKLAQRYPRHIFLGYVTITKDINVSKLP